VAEHLLSCGCRFSDGDPTISTVRYLNWRPCAAHLDNRLADVRKAHAEVCPECEGRGEVLDAPSHVLDGHPYWTPCPACGRRERNG
jgi:hypothetical protein